MTKIVRLVDSEYGHLFAKVLFWTGYPWDCNSKWPFPGWPIEIVMENTQQLQCQTQQKTWWQWGNDQMKEIKSELRVTQEGNLP